MNNSMLTGMRMGKDRIEVKETKTGQEKSERKGTASS